MNSRLTLDQVVLLETVASRCKANDFLSLPSKLIRHETLAFGERS